LGFICKIVVAIVNWGCNLVQMEELKCKIGGLRVEV
jgi:hypothetical protein